MGVLLDVRVCLGRGGDRAGVGVTFSAEAAKGAVDM